MLKNRDIVIVGLQPWDLEILSNRKHMAFELAKHNRVLFVNSPLDRASAIRQKNDPLVRRRLRVLRGQDDELVQVGDNIWNFYPQTVLEPVSQIRINCLFDLLNFSNNRKFAREINRAIQQLNFSDIILFNDSDLLRGFYLKDLLSSELFVYYTRDNFLPLRRWQRQGHRLLPRILAKADLVVSNSHYLTAAAESYNANSFFVGQGCCLEDFDANVDYPRPAIYAKIPQPIVGFMGALRSSRLDENILLAIAKQRPNWSIVLLGPEDDDFKNSTLHKQKNVYFLGNVDSVLMPQFAAHFDVAIHPQKNNEITVGNYPRKIDEYLALGLPIVATHTVAMDFFKELVYLVEVSDSFVPLIEQALKENSKELQYKRIALANQHTWLASANLLSNFIKETERKMKIAHKKKGV